MEGDKNKGTYIFADCDCGVKHKSYNIHKLKTGETKSCGHLHRKHDVPYKTNEIVKLNDGITCKIITTNKGKREFLFDSDDMRKLDGMYWYEDDYGYLTHCEVKDGKNKYIRFHRLVMGARQNEYVDHINRDKRDNRKSNLRICKHIDNDRNKDISSKNTSGYIGVGYDNARKKWKASITVNRKSIYLGRYPTIEEAIVARLRAEKEYFGEYAPQQFLYKEYGI